ncbi:MAG: hypothetical protein AAB373_00970, partial [Patescibacteria group bacterium]
FLFSNIFCIQPAHFQHGDRGTESTGLAKSRYIPLDQKRAALHKTDGRCAYPSCNRPPQVFHHTDRFALSHSHESIIPICKMHHEFAHNGLITNEIKEVRKWKLEIESFVREKQGNQQINKIDKLYQVYRQ